MSRSRIRSCAQRVALFPTVVGCAACYVLGTIWFMILTGADLVSALGWCVLPYLPGDVIKIALAAILTIQLDKRMPNL